jgi:hypothetical protein
MEDLKSEKTKKWAKNPQRQGGFWRSSSICGCLISLSAAFDLRPTTSLTYLSPSLNFPIKRHGMWIKLLIEVNGRRLAHVFFRIYGS